MVSHQPPKNAHDLQSEILQTVHDTLNDTAPAEQQRPAPPAQDAQSPQASHETAVELDRSEVYLRGPTAFSA